MLKDSTGRVRCLNQADVNADGEFVLYWMTGARRTRYSFALERALEWCAELRKPLVVLEALRAGYRWASDRHHAFIIGGMVENAARLQRPGVTAYPYVEPEPDSGSGLFAALAKRACLVVADDAPVFFLRRMTEKSAKKTPVLVEGVDGNGLLPLSVPQLTYPSAAVFRRVLHRDLPEHLGDFPAADPLRRAPKLAAPDLGAVHERWPPLDLDAASDPAAYVANLPIDHDVPPVADAGGAEAAVRRWRKFLKNDLAAYGQSGKRTLDNPSSGLSPYLHYGHISPHQVVSELFRSEDWSPARIDSSARGKRAGWWGLSEPAETFLDQIVTWRELGLNMHHREKKPEAFGSLPDWAVETLEHHASDPREHLYSRKEFEGARTHDPLWNAAQRQLLTEGTIHNYLRMLWGKKILEWSRSPRKALEIMIELNNRHALDGRDPNSTSGIFWVLGRYDRPWAPERPVFGRVRFMSSANTARKMDTSGYLREHGSPDDRPAGESGRLF